MAHIIEISRPVTASMAAVQSQMEQRLAALESGQGGNGSPLGTLTPTHAGQTYADVSVTPPVIWVATGTTNSDWEKVIE